MKAITRLASVVGLPLSAVPRDFDVWNNACILRRVLEDGVVPPVSTRRKCIHSHSHKALNRYESKMDVSLLEDNNVQGKHKLTKIYRCLIQGDENAVVSLVQERIQRHAPLTLQQSRDMLDKIAVCSSRNNRKITSTRVIFDMYRLHCNGIPTKRRLAFGNLEPESCYMCGRGVDSIEHWLDGCSVVLEAHESVFGPEITTLQTFLLNCDESFHKLSCIFWSMTVRAHQFRKRCTARTIITMINMVTSTNERRPPRVASPEIPGSYHTIFFNHQYMRISHVEADCVASYSLRNKSVAVPEKNLHINDSAIHIFLDGSSKEIEQELFGGYGFAIFGICSAPLTFCGPVEHDNATNNVAELMCFIKAAEYILCSEDADSFVQRGIVLHFDSNFALNSVLAEQNRSKSDATLYQLQREAWLKFEEIRAFTTIKADHIYSHAGITPNEIVDNLADDGRQGIIKYRSCTNAMPFGSPVALQAIRNLPYNNECNPRIWFR